MAALPAIVLAEDTAGIPEIIVTAERREANLQTVPIAVSAFDATMIRNRQITDTQSLQLVVPSLKMTNNITSPTNLSPSLRGSLQQDASLIVAESPFGMYVDDVYVGRLNGNNLALNDIERVEVLRGPQGTLYGRNTLQGAIKFVSRTPGQDPWFNATAGVGNFNQNVIGFSAGAPISDTLAGSLAGQYNTKDGEYYNAVTKQNTDRQDNTAFRGKLHYSGIDNADVVLGVSYVKSTNDSLPLVNATTPGVPNDQQFNSDQLVPTFGNWTIGTPTQNNITIPGDPPTVLLRPAPPPITANPSGETQQTIVSLNAAYDFDAFTVRSITGFVRTTDFFSTDFSGIGTVIGASDVAVNQWSEELQISGTALNEKLSYLAGLYYLNEQGSQDFGWYFFLPVSTSQIRATTNAYAAFTQLDYKITDALKATAGVRWSKDEKSFRINQQLTDEVLNSPFAGFTNPDLNRVTLDNNYEEWTPRFALEYTFQSLGSIDNLMTYVSASRGFKSGGYNGIAIFNLGDAQTAYGPEKNWTYEGGFKGDAFDRRVQLNLAYFWAQITDLTANATQGFTFPVQNVGDADVHGFEAELTALPMEHLTVFWTGAFSHGSYGSLVPGSAPAQAPAKWDVAPRVPQVPRWAFTLGFDYALPVTLPGANSGTFHVGGDWFYTDQYVTSATNDFVASSYDRYNGFVGLDVGDHWSVRFAVKNIADSADITSGSRFTGNAGLGGFIQLPPREYLLSANYKL